MQPFLFHSGRESVVLCLTWLTDSRIVLWSVWNWWTGGHSDIQQVLQTASKPVKLVNDKLITLTDIRKQLVQNWTFLHTRLLFRENLLTLGIRKSSQLHVQVLTCGWYSCISYFYSVYDLIRLCKYTKIERKNSFSFPFFQQSKSVRFYSNFLAQW